MLKPPRSIRAQCFVLTAAALMATSARGDSSLSPGPAEAPRFGEVALAIPRVRFTAGVDLPPLRASLSSLPEDEEPPRYERSFLIPALEVPAFAVAVNLFDRWVLQEDWAQTHGLDAFWEHLFHGPWKFDDDTLRTNFVAHPYNGALYFDLARSTGLSFWWSFVYAFGGSLLFELGGETLPPSVSDQIVTPVGGALLGEAFYRTFVLILTAEERPGFWREVGAFLVAPTAGLNRVFFGDRFRTREFDEQPELFFMAEGGVGYAQLVGADPPGAGESAAAGSAFELRYGQPASPEFRADRPFNHFTLDVVLNGDEDGVREALLLRGLLGGWRLDEGPFRGVLGFFGQYDSLSGGLFRLGGVSLGPGATGQFRLAAGLDLQATVTLSVLLQGAVATSKVKTVPYHSGPGERAELAVRLYVGPIARVDLGARQFFVLGNSTLEGTDHVSFVRAAAFLRVSGPHAIGLEGTWANRISLENDGPDIHQRSLTATLNYAWMSGPRFGAAAWDEGERGAQ